MFDIGWTEMVVLAIIAIIFVGPKELPGMVRSVAQVVKKLRSLAHDFYGQFDKAMKDAEIDELKKTLSDPLSIGDSAPNSDKKKKQTPEEIEAQISRDYAEAQRLAREANKSSGPNAVPGFGVVEDSAASTDTATTATSASSTTTATKDSVSKDSIPKSSVSASEGSGT